MLYRFGKKVSLPTMLFLHGRVLKPNTSFSFLYKNKLSLDAAIVFPAGIYLLIVNNRNTRTRCEICSKLTIKTPERRH